VSVLQTAPAAISSNRAVNRKSLNVNKPLHKAPPPKQPNNTHKQANNRQETKPIHKARFRPFDGVAQETVYKHLNETYCDKSSYNGPHMRVRNSTCNTPMDSGASAWM
jgi:hypothetical protein